MTPLVKRLLILAVVVILGAAGVAVRVGAVHHLTSALGINGRSGSKVATARPARGHQSSAPTQAVAHGPQAKPAASDAPAPIQAAAGLGISGPSPSPSSTPAAAAKPAEKAVQAPGNPAAAGLTPPSSKFPVGVPTGSGAAQSAPQSATGSRAQRAGGPAAEPFIDPTERLSSWMREPYHYASLGRRDPFASLVNGDFESEGEVGLVDVGDYEARRHRLGRARPFCHGRGPARLRSRPPRG